MIMYLPIKKLIFLLTFFFNVVFAQSTDSIQLLINKNKTEELTKEEYLVIINHLGENKQYANGLVYSEKLIKLCQKTKDTNNLVKAINRKAENLIDLGKTEDGITFCEDAFKVFRTQDSIQLELLCFKWGMLYQLNNEPNKAYEIYKKIKSERFKNLNIYQNNISIIHASLGNYDSAVFYLKNVLETGNFDYLDQKSVAYSNLGYYSLNQHKNKEALAFFDSAYVYRDKLEDYRGLKDLFNNYYHTYKRLGLVDEAYKVLDSINKYNELIFNQKLEEEIQELNNASHREKNLRQKVKIVDGKIEQYERQFLLWIMIILFLIVMVIFYFFYRNIKAKNNLIILEQKLLRSQMTPHFIFNSLSVIQGMILNNENQKAVSYLSKFSKLMRIILENSRSKLVLLEDELNAVKNYLDLQNLKMEKVLAYSIHIDSSLDVANVLIPPMLIQPFVENAIEHGFKSEINYPKISVHIKSVDKIIICEIMDNGVGINKVKKDDNPQKKSVSTDITAERLVILAKEYKAKSSIEIMDRSLNNQQGTKVILTFPRITN